VACRCQPQSHLGQLRTMSEGTSRIRGVAKKVLLVNQLRGRPAAQPAEDSSPNIKVCVRLRPFIKEEIEGDRSGGQCVLCVAMPTINKLTLFGEERDKREFEFDRCYWSHSKEHELYATQETLYQELGTDMITQALNGFNNCIFAYGQTGSGKSFSVLGGKEISDQGLLPRIVSGLFQSLDEIGSGTIYKCRVSFLEIYNEQIRDLLVTDATTKEQKLEVRQHPVLGTIVPGLSESPVTKASEVMSLVDYGATMRHVSATAMNASSSRSHCIFSFKTVVSTVSELRTGVVEKSEKMSQTHLVDLAGSERAGRTHATGDRLKEGAAINQSLSTLARVISDLAKQSAGVNKAIKTKPAFRDSKLTYILKESLSGNSKTVMMAAISPNYMDYDETLSTLKFCQTVKLVQTSSKQNETSENKIEMELRRELEELREQLKRNEMDSASCSSRSASRISKRYSQSAALYSVYGEDWEKQLARERRNQTKREAIIQDVEALQEQLKLIAGPEQDGDSSDGSSIWDGKSDSDQDASATQSNARTMSTSSWRGSGKLHPCIVRLLRAEFDVGPSRGRELSRQLYRVEEVARQIEDAVGELSTVSASRLTVRGAVDVDPTTFRARVRVCVARARIDAVVDDNHVGINTEEDEDEGNGRAPCEWLTVCQLEERYEWLMHARALGGTSEFPDAWKAAAAATSGAALSRMSAAPEVENELKALRSALAFAEAKLSTSVGGPQTRPGRVGGWCMRSAKPYNLANAIASSFNDVVGNLDMAERALEAAVAQHQANIGCSSRALPVRRSTVSFADESSSEDEENSE